MDKWRTGHTAQERTKQVYTFTTTPKSVEVQGLATRVVLVDVRPPT